MTRLLIAKFGEGFPARGIFCVDGGGHDRALSICKALLRAGFQIAAVVDDEGRKQGSWEEVGRQAALLRWEDGATVEKAVLGALPDNILPLVVTWPEEAGGKEVRHCLADLRTAFGAEDKSGRADQMLEQHGRDAFLEVLCRVACPPRQGNKKPKGWFKSFDGGYLLAEKLLALGPAPEGLNEQISAFLTTIETATA